VSVMARADANSVRAQGDLATPVLAGWRTIRRDVSVVAKRASASTVTGRDSDRVEDEGPSPSRFRNKDRDERTAR
jgi:hypothetical protein